MSYISCIEEMKKQKFAPVYYFYGTETYMIEALKQALISNGLEKEEKDTNFEVYDLEETSIQEVITDAETFPFFGERKIILATNASFLKAKPPKMEVDHRPDVLIEYLENPAPYSIVVLIAPYEKVDERKKVVKRLKKETKAVSCEPLKERELQKVITSIANQHNVKLSEQVITYFINEIGTNMMIIHSEMEKLALYVGEGNEIRLEDAKLLLSSQESSSSFKLMDAIMNNDLAKAIDITKDLEKMNEEPIALIALIASQYRTLMHVKILKQKGYTQQQMASQLKVHPYVAKLSMQRQAKFQLKELKRAIDLLTETDAQIKSGRMDKSLAFELLLYQLIATRQRVS
ncbi:DNA polymerase III subunit delta [Gracilibacillus caseinilyticus]|uniref:DNA polymerase III subunit delta n=1 Tax=Gracilibacillus caseinilyticus TaxID=2932256 RepID=A0ABY4ESI9_9BACI|nr:DNA polymerase III subunit delta [Gracilibacillus caseinilyticus]UOQ47394.1 DNA polymerase III subunit delta [Gracilibacillus caseinilyticus]